MNDMEPIDLSVIIPLYNEQECVEPLLRALRKVFAEESLRHEIILVDDGSTDDTYAVAIAHSDFSKLPIRIISLQRNFGQTAAMQAGIDASTGRLIATLDGDLQNDPADILAMVRHLEDNDLDLLVGRRANRQDGLILRLIPSWIANRLIAQATGVRIRDYGCSLKIYRGCVIRQIRLMGEMHRFIPAWVAAVTDPSRIGEIDVSHQAREFGKSKYGISRTIRVVIDLLSVIFFLKYRNRPGHFFGSCGLFVGSLAVAMLAFMFVVKFMFGQDIGTRPMLQIGVVAMLSSMQLICFGIMAEMLARTFSSGEGASSVVQSNSSNRGYWVRHEHQTVTLASAAELESITRLRTHVASGEVVLSLPESAVRRAG